LRKRKKHFQQRLFEEEIEVREKNCCCSIKLTKEGREKKKKPKQNALFQEFLESTA
jgi:hypothetical protein